MRTEILPQIRDAGWHGDWEKASRLYQKNQVPYFAYRDAYWAGMKNRQNGLVCKCDKCRKETT